MDMDQVLKEMRDINKKVTQSLENQKEIQKNQAEFKKDQAEFKKDQVEFKKKQDEMEARLANQEETTKHTNKLVLAIKKNWIIQTLMGQKAG